MHNLFNYFIYFNLININVAYFVVSFVILNGLLSLFTFIQINRDYSNLQKKINSIPTYYQLFYIIFWLILLVSSYTSQTSISNSHFNFTNTFVFFSFLISFFYCCILIIYSYSSRPSNTLLNESYMFMFITYIWLTFLFSITNFFSFLFYIELLSLTLLILLALNLSLNNEFLVNTYKTNFSINNSHYFMYSFLYLFWISFLSILNLFLFLIYAITFLGSLDYSLIFVLINYKLFFLDQLSLISIFSVFVLFLTFSFLKMGLIPFFVWKPNFFKAIPLNFLFFYIGFYYFFIFIYFVKLITTVFIGLLETYFIINIILFICVLAILILCLFKQNFIKIFIAYSSILNSTLILYICFFI